MKLTYVIAVLCTLLLVGSLPPAKGATWKMLWSDEFDGDKLDKTKWRPMLGDGSQFFNGTPGWGNNEVETYTNSPDNLRLSKGKLNIQALRLLNSTYTYTSAKLTTQKTFAIKPNNTFPTIKIEARMKVPRGHGMWPAFWMLPAEPASLVTQCSGCGLFGNWPASGSINIAEFGAKGDATMTKVDTTIYYGGTWPNVQNINGTFSFPDKRSLADTFHIYSIEWSRKKMVWKVDGQTYLTAYAKSAKHPDGWYTDGSTVTGSPFNKKFFLVLNLAMAGPETAFNPTPTKTLNKVLKKGAKVLKVDYVRVYGK